MCSITRPGDLLVAKTDPPLSSVLAMRAARRQGAHLINWLQDVYPEVALQLGVPFVKGPIFCGLRHLRDASLKAATINVVVGEHMAAMVRSRRVATNRIRVIPNWVDDEHISPLTDEKNTLRAEWGLEGKFVIGYSGNLGRAHEFETILDAAESFRNDSGIAFVLIGGGHRSDELRRSIERRGLGPSFQFMPYQRLDRLRHSLAVPDVHWVSLRPELEGLILPSKLYGIAAAGKPLIAVSSIEGELAQLIRRYQFGYIVEPGNSEGLARAIEELRIDHARRATMGKNARAMLDAQFNRKTALLRWSDIIEQLARH
jgi:colanic acid biosynthesis glycosyl transferase WcaI